MKPQRIAVVGTPRSGSSYLVSVLENLGYKMPNFPSQVEMNSSQFNPDGYFEDTFLTLLHDQLIRYSFGNEFSFLNPPIISSFCDPGTQRDDWTYDLDSLHIDYPDDYLNQLSYYCGHDWDVWGLSRMQGDGKWSRIYSKLGIEKTLGLLESHKIVCELLKTMKGIVIKDARLVFVLDKYPNIFDTIIFLTRNHETFKKSVQSHYGKRIFEGPVFEGYSWVSNHFNYKVPFYSFSQYVQRYEQAIASLEGNANILRVTLEEIDTKDKARIWCERNLSLANFSSD